MGEVQQVDAGGGPTRYGPNTDQAHHPPRVPPVAASCTTSTAVGEENLRLPRGRRFGYRIVNRESLFQGYCPRCRAV